MSIIKIENLSKKYIIGHDRHAGNTCSYKSLRETLSHSARGIYQRLRHPLSPNRENTELEEFWALKDINFEIKQGERVGIIGRNGAGKSTLLKILSRITEPTTGKITLNGRVASLLEVGTGFHPELTGRENIFLNGAVLGMSRLEIKKKFDEIVDFSGVEKFLDTPVKRYSSGMYVRLAFSVAAHLEPEILLVDEVLAVGDAEFQKKCLGKMEDVSKEGRTILFVSHNMAAIKTFCTKGLLIESGKIKSKSDNIKIIINNYNRISESSCTTLSWSSVKENLLANEYIDILGYKVVDRFNNQAISKLDSLTTYKFSVEFNLKKSYSEIKIGYALFDSDNFLLLMSVINDNGNIDLGDYKPGNYCFEAPIPIKLLNEGMFKIELICVIERIGWILPINNFSQRSFHVYRNDIKSKFKIRRIGKTEAPIFPVLAWDERKY